jgi:hypothetical protein
MAPRQGIGSPGDKVGGPRLPRRALLKSAAAGAGALLLTKANLAAARGARPSALAPLGRLAPASVARGPSTTVASYVLPSLPAGVDVTAILTVGDRAENGYRMVGIPDGLGVLATGQTFALFMNHELRSGSGIARAHGSSGAFVSRWVIDRETLQVVSGADLTPSPDHVHRWNAAARQYTPGGVTWDRLCSADLPAETALRYGDRGTAERIFFDGDEVTGGRAWARIATGPHAGEAWELPRLGKMAFENVVACPYGQAKTVVALFDDGALDTAPVAANNPSEVFVYVGTKQSDGNEIERAGLTNGKLYGLRVSRDNALVTEESDALGLGDGATGYVSRGRFALVELGAAGDVSGLTGEQMEQNAIDKGVLRLQRPEDGAWDPREGRNGHLYFVTTASLERTSRLWRLAFDDVERPEAGGTIEILLTNTPGRMFDNVTIDRLGRLLIQEDTGSNPWVSKIWLYGIDNGSLTEIAHHDPAVFEPGGARFITQDEESSGIVDAAHILGEGWFLFVVQVHKADDADPELVAGGQLLALYVDPQIGR